MSNLSMKFIAKLTGKVPTEFLKIVQTELEIFLSDYDFNERETNLVPLNSFPECYIVYISSKKIEGKSEKTINAYRFYIESFLHSINKQIDCIGKNDILLYLNTKNSLSSVSRDNIRRALNAFFSWCVDNEYIKSNPCRTIPPIKGKKNIRHPLTEEEMERLRDAIDNRVRNNSQNIKERDKAIFEFLFSTGARVSELIFCNRSDVSFKDNTVLLFGKGGKYRNSYLNARAEYALTKYLSLRTDDNDALFVTSKKPYKRLSVGAVEKILKQYGESIGIECFPHKIRHTMATQGLKHGMPITDIQKLLGHKKTETTMIYAEVLDENIKFNHNKYIN